MTPYLNNVFLIGRLTQEPEVRYTPKGTPWASLNLAVNESYQKETQERVEKTVFINLKLWGQIAECANDFHKGSQVVVEGYLRTDHWEDKQTGEKRSAMNVVVESMQTA